METAALSEEDATLMAVSREWELPRLAEATGIDARWLSAFVAVRVSDILAQLATGKRLKELQPSERAFIREQVEQTIEDVTVKFKPHFGDPEYQPELEPEYDFEGRTEGETR